MAKESHHTMESKEQHAEPVRILCAANAAYSMPLCVMLTSVLINHTQGREIEIYILATRIPAEDRQRIEASLAKNCPNFKNTAIHWLAPSLDLFQNFPLTEYADIEVYSRLLAPFVLPADCDKILYLDCDTIVLSDLSPLYDSPCSKAILAVRDEIGVVSAQDIGVFNYADLGIHPETPYFNSGVMLINLKYWKEHRVAERAIEYLNQHLEAVICWDQGALNAILYDSWTQIDPVWNSMRCSLHPEIWKRNGRSMVDWKRTLYRPKLVHYTGEKPWNEKTQPRYSYFFKYLDRTDYRGTIPDCRWERVVGFRLNYLLWRAKAKHWVALVRGTKNILRPVLGRPYASLKKLLNKQ